MRTVILMLATFGAAGCGSPTSPDAAPQRKQVRQKRMAMRVQTEPSPIGPVAELGFFDAHVHLNDVDMARTVMDEYGIDRAVSFWGRDSTNASLVAAAKEHPDRFAPFVSFSPERDEYRTYWDAGDLALLEQLDDALGSGAFAGIGELSVTHLARGGFPEAAYGPLHPLTLGTFELAKKHRVAVNIHCEATDVDDLAELLRRFPDVTVLWAHGGYTSAAVAERMLEAHPNLIYELSARTWRHHPGSPEYTIYETDQDVAPRWLALIEAHSTRFVVGTDASLHDIDRARAKVGGVQRLLEQLTPPTRDRVAQGNLIRILRPAG